MSPVSKNCQIPNSSNAILLFLKYQSEILATQIDESWTHHFQLVLTKVFKFKILTMVKLTKIFKFKILTMVELTRVFKFKILTMVGLTKVFKFKILTMVKLTKVFKFKILTMVELTKFSNLRFLQWWNSPTKMFRNVFRTPQHKWLQLFLIRRVNITIKWIPDKNNRKTQNQK